MTMFRSCRCCRRSRLLKERRVAMEKFCTQCGFKQDENNQFCLNCGARLRPPVPAAPEQMQTETTGQKAEKPQKEVKASQKDKKKEKKVAKKATKKPGKKYGLLKAAGVLVGVALLLLGAWYAFGNQLTLHLHSKDVVEVLNSGSLDVPGAPGSDMDDIPDYVKEMIGENVQVKNENGPLLGSILPFIQVEDTKVKGYFGGNQVVYTISAPDVETWLLELDGDSLNSAEDLIAALRAYLPNAPRRVREVTVSYERSGFFTWDWEGMYETPEFTDAVSGGFNSAYSVLYDKAIEELEAMLG